MRDSSSRSRLLRSVSGLQFVLGVNILVFVAWQVLGRNLFMYQNFMTSVSNLESLRVWTLLTAAFSHIDLWHFLINMLVLYSFSAPLEARWGRRKYLMFYFGAALFSSLLHCSMTLFGFADIPALGASGAVCAMTSAFAIYYPRVKIYIYGILPVPAWACAAAFVAFDIKGLLDQANGGGGNIGHAAHLGGAIFALIAIGVIGGNLTSGLKKTIAKKSSTSRSPSEYYPSRRSDSQVEVPERDLSEEMRLDELLRKVSTSGVESLTDEERDDLRRIGEKRRSGQ